MGTYPTPAAPISDEALRKTFTMTVLLTGSVGRAEALMLDVIRQMDPERVSNQDLFRRSVKAAITSQRAAPRKAGALDDASSSLPKELRQILNLPEELRHCFVLRTLAGFTREDCAELNLPDADQAAGAAAAELAQFRAAECV